jgi:hypothetical protein
MAQEPGRTYRVGGVSGGARNAPPFVAMVDELGRLGFIDGKTSRSNGTFMDRALI